MFRQLILNALAFACLLSTTSLQAQSSYTAKWQVRHYAAGASAPSQTAWQTEARRADGSVVRIREVVSPLGEKGEAVEIINLAKRQMIRVEPFTASKTTTTLSAAEVLLQQMATEACKQQTATPEMQSTRLARNVVLVISNNPDSPFTQSDWVAPELACLALESTTAAADGSHADRVLASLDSTAPSADLFLAPQYLTERTAEETAKIYSQKYSL